ncbi:multidrug efflux MFS transporter [Paenibacillus cremeus]|uniref:Multidrug efflux MFS transporter n=1 Tax=Paenibacillus cremeus TaxID=2163881 RepID=A0A559KAM1_9BACL|nr:multidrug efflux MFS transporter [Paenibacillus cremeus]TVY09181.1 multidrug efflux MFS transporter [Paenibacillus cremeus]
MILPFLSVFVQELGVRDIQEAAVWSAMIFGSNHLMVTLTSSFWGRLSDTYGQKVMLIRGI